VLSSEYVSESAIVYLRSLTEELIFMSQVILFKSTSSLTLKHKQNSTIHATDILGVYIILTQNSGSVRMTGMLVKFW
jgi:hypothetical protein